MTPLRSVISATTPGTPSRPTMETDEGGQVRANRNADAVGKEPDLIKRSFRWYVKLMPSISRIIGPGEQTGRTDRPASLSAPGDCCLRAGRPRDREGHPSLRRSVNGGLILLPTPINSVHRHAIFALTERHAR